VFLDEHADENLLGLLAELFPLLSNPELERPHTGKSGVTKIATGELIFGI